MYSCDKLQELLANLQGLDTEASRWFLSGINHSLATGQSLDQTLGIRGARYRFLKQRRDDFLHQAWESLSGDLTPWRRSSLLSEQVFQFETRKWQRIQHHAEAPEHLNQIETLIFEAFKLGLRVPSTPRQLHNIVKLKTVHFSQNTD